MICPVVALTQNMWWVGALGGKGSSAWNFRMGGSDQHIRSIYGGCFHVFFFPCGIDNHFHEDNYDQITFDFLINNNVAVISSTLFENV